MKTIEARTFLEMVWPQPLLRNETVELRAIERKTGVITRRFYCSIDEFLSAAGKFGEGFDIYFAMCTRFGKTGGKKQDCFRTKCFWVDFDREGEEPDLSKVPPPHIVVKSGKGTHIYWLMDTPVYVRSGRWKEIEAVNRALCTKLNGDKMCIDVTRILRVPGFSNYKYNPPRKVIANVLD